jgi:energy-coupling factor transporter ATP-binding protein EcfA2
VIVEVILRHYKTYNNINKIPISRDSNFVTYIGDNGIGKSSIFEALDTLFNKKKWNINLKALSGGGLNNRNEPYVSCLFALSKEKIKKEYIEIFKELDTVFRKEFTDYKDKFEEQYLIQVGKKYYSNKQPEIFFGKDAEIEKIILDKSDNINESKVEQDQRTKGKLIRKKSDIGEYILSLYSYIYIPVEMDISEFSFLVNSEMQKLTGKNIRNEIRKIITDAKLREMNNKLKTLVDGISHNLNEYSYDFKSSGKKKYQWKL